MLLYPSLSFFAKDVDGHLLSAALPWKLNYQKDKGEIITYQCDAKIKFEQWNKLILLTTEQIPDKCNHCRQQFHLLWTEMHIPPLCSYNSLWSTRMKASSNCRQMNPYSLFVCRACTDSKQRIISTKLYQLRRKHLAQLQNGNQEGSVAPLLS